MPASETKSAPQIVKELVELNKTYARQQTIDPLKQLGRFIGFGTGAAIIGGTGVILVLLGVLRVLQTETGAHLRGNWSWVPYAGTLFVAFLLAAIAAAAITRKKGTRP